MAGIYIHIPFCKQKCGYCNFYSVADNRHQSEYVSALNKELLARKNYLEHQSIETIYFGGGTPALLSTDVFNKIVDLVSSNFNLTAKPEITIEANPDNLTKKKIDELSASSINRISMGVQSFYDEDLKYLNRIHTAHDIDFAVKYLQDKGITNISADLIFGIPTLSDSKLRENIGTLLDLNIPHISAYALTVETQTPLWLLIAEGKKNNTDEEKVANQFDIVIKSLTDEGFLHYEISNYSLSLAHISKHNSSYWLQKPYLGLGASAHSFDGNSRRWNCSDIDEYIEGVVNNKIFFDSEELNSTQKYNELVMTRLRTMWGLDTGEMFSFVDSEFVSYFIKNIAKYVDDGLVVKENNSYTLNNRGKIISDRIISDLFFV